MHHVNMANNLIKSFDLFGYKIEFNYNRMGSNYRTTCGGIMSILIQVFVYFVFAMRIYQMVEQSNPQISSEKTI